MTSFNVIEIIMCSRTGEFPIKGLFPECSIIKKILGRGILIEKCFYRKVFLIVMMVTVMAVTLNKKKVLNRVPLSIFLCIDCLLLCILRRGRDSNSRTPFEVDGFQDRWFKPLTHPSDYRYEMSHVVTV